MSTLFYGASAVAIAATLLAITRAHAVHALLYLIVSLLGVAATMLALGAPLAAMLEVMVYAGAIMVLFVFVVMLLNLGPGTSSQERLWLRPRFWLGPGVLSGLLLVQLLGVVLRPDSPSMSIAEVGPKAVGIALYGPYLLAVELASMLLLAGLVAAYHLGRPGR
ncbi:NADH-quinone oxidoreductase subunit J [Sinimarinibacterium sp. CAU 1509]|uniref:NADH-quinone oxidoreductase subunit J n=1 Tax=Sinimarinibacterium sp. CAU 1509 TaxID=2562283 RepID=UPI0010AB7ECE|nr:NADH-quinone oxidoreductase subunit J [Sinimarinibacterium sp. CAU 1509]TJY64753.1 NADH-quinone oxidoreductase subunit J [Sinimarinibacterium sp. CAU 1509]